MTGNDHRNSSTSPKLNVYSVTLCSLHTSRAENLFHCLKCPFYHSLATSTYSQSISVYYVHLCASMPIQIPLKIQITIINREYPKDFFYYHVSFDPWTHTIPHSCINASFTPLFGSSPYVI